MSDLHKQWSDALAALGSAGLAYEAQIANLEAETEMLADSVASRSDTITEQAAEIISLSKQLFRATHPADVYLTVGSEPYATSNYISSLAYVNNTDLRLNTNATAKARAEAALSQSFTLHRFAIGGSFGASPDPFNYSGVGTYPSGNPTGWGSVDAIVTWMQSMGHTPVCTLYNFPWWTRGKWTGSTTIPLTLSDQFSDDGRPITERWSYCKTMARTAIRRYLAAPYNVRWFCTGYEFHGFERARDGGFSTLGYDAYSGTVGQADMGMAYVHNQLYAILLEEAAAQGIARNQLHIIPNYPRVRTRGVANSSCYPLGHPLRDRVWGSAEKFGPETLFAYLPLLTPGSYDYWGYDVGSLNTGDNVQIAGYFDNNVKFSEIHAYQRDQLAALGITVPGAVMEIYPKPNTDPGAGSQQLRGAIYADAFGRLIAEGAGPITVWSPVGRAHEPGIENESGQVTYATTESGGVPQPAYDAQKMYHDHFQAGAQLYPVTVEGAGVYAKATADCLVAVNVTNAPVTVCVDEVYTLPAFGWQAVARG